MYMDGIGLRVNILKKDCSIYLGISESLIKISLLSLSNLKICFQPSHSPRLVLILGGQGGI